MDFYKKPEGQQAKGSSGWIGPAAITDLTSKEDGVISVKWNGRVRQVSLGNTRHHMVHHQTFMYNSILGKDSVIKLRDASKRHEGKIGTYVWNTPQAKKSGELYQSILNFAVTDVQLPGCIGTQVGTLPAF